MNSILSMCCSVAASYAMSIYIKGKFSVIDLFNGSLSGAIGAGSSAGLFVNPCACMIIGTISGVVCILGMEYLTGWLEKNWKIFDTFGIHNVRGLPGIIGGLGGAIGIALSFTIPEDAILQLSYLSKHEGRSIGQMAGFQVLGTFSTVILSFLAGMFTGWIITHFYNIEAKNFYMDNIYF
jgi:ammonium transporter Rh